MTIREQVLSNPPNSAPHVAGCRATHYLSVPVGVQAVVHIAGSDALVIVGNPDNGDQPVIITRADGANSKMRLPNCVD